MTNHERYRAAFSGVHAPADCVQKVLEHLQTAPSGGVKERRPLRTALILAAAAVLLTVTVGAELSNGTVSNFLAPLYGGTQTELVDSIGCPVDASTTANGYTLTADAVIRDRYNIVVVYTLTRDDGQPIPESVHFDQYSNSLYRFSSGGGSMSMYRDDEMPENQVKFVEQWTSTGRLLFFRNAHVAFEDLEVWDAESGTSSLLAEGTWELNFTVRYRDTTVSVPVDDLEVAGTDGITYQIRKILLSPLGLHMDLKILNIQDLQAFFSQRRSDFTVSLLLEDGSELELGNTNFGSSGSEGETTGKGDYGAFFDQPIPLEEISVLVICGTEVPVNAAK